MTQKKTYQHPAPVVKNLPKWFLDMRAGADFMPMDIKPASYEFVSKLESIHRSSNYGTTNKKWQYVNPETYPAAGSEETTPFNPGVYNTPTKDVTTKLNTNANLGQDLKNLGQGKAPTWSLGYLYGFMDEISRPLYAVNGMYRQQLLKGKDPSSAGGENLTVGEHFGAFWRTNTPLGLASTAVDTASAVKKIKEGKSASDLSLDEKTGLRVGNALIKGATKKQRVYGEENIKLQFPDFAAQHPKAAGYLGIASDLFFDPANYVTVGMNPGTVVKGTLAGGALVFGKPGARIAADLASETLLTNVGREAAMNSLRTSRSQSSLRSLNRQARRNQRNANRGSVVKPLKGFRKPESVREAKAQVLAQKIADTATEELVGAQLAGRIIRDIPRTGGLNLIGAASAWYLGAGAGSTALRSARTIQDIQRIHNASVAANLENLPTWKNYYKFTAGENISYEHGGKRFTVETSKAKDFNEWMDMVIREASPLAKYAEYSNRAARARKGRIVGVEGRGAAFIGEMNARLSRHTLVGLSDAAKRAFHTANAYEGISAYPTSTARGHYVETIDENHPAARTEGPGADTSTVVIDIKTLSEMSLDDVQAAAQATYNSQKDLVPNGGYSDRGSRIVVRLEDGTHRLLSVSTLRRAAAESERLLGIDARRAAVSAVRTPEARAADAASGVSERVAATRDAFINQFDEFVKADSAHRAAQVAREAELAAAKADEAVAVEKAMDAASNVSPKAKEYLDTINDAIYKSTSFTEEDKLRWRTILEDESRPFEERLVEILTDPNMPTSAMEDMYQDVFDINFNVHIGGPNNRKVHASAVGDEGVSGAVRDIFKAVLKDRWSERLGIGGADDLPTNAEVAGVAAEIEDKYFILKSLERKLDNPDGPSYTRDATFEISMMLMDAHRATLEWAVKQDLINQPEELIAEIKKATDLAINELSADTKIQVMSHLFNMYGLRLPEKFVPTHVDIDTLFDSMPDDFFGKTNKGTVVKRDNALMQLGRTAQQWAIQALPFITAEQYAGKSADAGWNLEKFYKDVLTRSRIRKINGEVYTEEILPLRQQIDALYGKTEEYRINGTTGAVNRYSMLDFLLHYKQIIESQKTTLVIKNIGGVLVGRAPAGRLSALDSFTFIDPEVKAGLEALKELNALTKSDNLDVARAAQRELSRLFIEHGLGSYLDELDTGGTKFLKDIKFNNLFKRLGTHARLKEEARTPNSDFGAKWRETLMNAMWQEATLNSEFQKALHQKILGLTVLDGNTPTTAAKLINQNIDKMFAGHTEMRNLIYPVNPEGKVLPQGTTEADYLAAGKDPEMLITGPVEKGKRAINEMGKRAQALRGGNELDYSRNQPQIELNVPQHTLPFKVDWTNVAVSTHPNAARGGPQFFVLHRPLNGAKVPFGVFTMSPKGTHVYFRPVNPDGSFIKGAEISLGFLKNQIHNGDIKFLVKALQDKLTTEVTTTGRHPYYNPGNQYSPRATLEKGVNKIETTKTVRKEMNQGPVTERINSLGEALRTSQEAVNARQARVSAEEGVAASKLPDENVQAAREGLGKAEADFLEAKAVQRELNATQEANRVTNPIEETAVETASSDFANVSGERHEYTVEEQELIKAWIADTYATHTPEELGRTLHALSSSMTADLILAQARIVTDAAEFNITHNASIRVAGLPLMDLLSFGNATHTQAGVTVLEQGRSFAQKFFGSVLNPEKAKTPQRRKALLRAKKRSHVLEQSLDRIATTNANAVAMSQREIINHLNALRIGLTRMPLTDSTVNGMGMSKRWRYLNEKFFGSTADGSLSGFNTAEGENFAEVIESDMELLASRIFLSDDPVSTIDMLRTANRHMDKRYRFSDLELDTIAKAYRVGGPLEGMTPYTREWFVSVSNLLSPDIKSKFNAEGIKDINMVILQYSLHNTELKLRAGRELQRAVWQEFAAQIPMNVAASYNKNLVPNTVGPDGKPMRGKLISLADLIALGRVERKHIPAQFLARGQHLYVQEMFVNDINTLFEFMDDAHELNDIINIGFINKITNSFKASVTIWNIPSYPINNAFGDIFISALAGVLNPRVYADSASILREVKQEMKDMDPADFSDLLDQSWMQHEALRAAHDPESVFNPDRATTGPTRITLHLLGGEKVNLSAHELWAVYNELGLGQNRVSMDIGESVAGARRNHMSVALGAFGDKIRTLNDVREDWTRMAHFLHAIKKHSAYSENIMDVFSRSGQEVIKHHFDYGDVSWYERKFLGPFIPFYKWMRNIVPYTVTQMLTKPIYMNAEEAVSQAIGITMNDDYDNKSRDLVVPEWIARENPVPIGLWSDPQGNTYQQFAVAKLPLSASAIQYLNPVIDPWIDDNIEGFRAKSSASAFGAVRAVGSRMGPIPALGIQALTDQQVWSSGPEPAKGDLYDALLKTVPGYAAGEATVKLINKSRGEEGSTGINKGAQILDYLGIQKVMTNSENSQLSSLNRLEDVTRNKIDVEKAKLAEKLKKKYPQLTDEQVALLIDQYLKQMRTPNVITQ